MPDITFACPHCRQSLEAPDDMAGETIACPACEQPIQLPQADGEPATVPENQACPNCGGDMEPDAVLCVQCGYHTGLGQVIQTSVS